MASSFNAGAVRTTDLDDIVIFGFTYQEPDDYTPFEDSGVDYVVPVSKILVVSFINITTNTASGTQSMGYADDTSGTNYVTLVGVGAIQPVTTTYHTCELPLSVPAGKYPLLLQTAGGFRGTALGVLVDA